MVTIYLIRHSEPLKEANFVDCKDTLQSINEKMPLSIKGEIKAQKLSLEEELQNINLLYSSNYVRAISTAKYIAAQNNLSINVINDFGERKFGINSWNELPYNFEYDQFLNENYKLPNGESQIDTRERMNKELTNIIRDNDGKRIVIISHATAIIFLLKKWCMITNLENEYQVKFNDKIIFAKPFSAPEVFKLEFNEENLVNICNIH